MQNLDSSVILDASAFYAGIPFLGSSKCYTTSTVFDEIKHIKKSFDVLETLIEAGKLEVRDPDEKYVRTAMVMARKSGDLAKLSYADTSIIALALEMKDSNPLIVTDDYAIANVAELASIKVSHVMGKGITRVGTWIRYCSICGILYKRNEKQCRVCGNKLRTKLKSKR